MTIACGSPWTAPTALRTRSTSASSITAIPGSASSSSIPTGTIPTRRREIYTQGEPEFNHYWFPCWDYPNDMATSETITTVPEGQVVVSNGKLVSVKRAAGQVTYDWVESVPHSSYLLSLAIGPWKKTADSYEGKPVDYYVPRGVDDAKVARLFHLTPDMIGFFSRATGVEYPFEKYDQVAVHDFIFGGQENVSATTLTDAALHDAQAEVDDPTTTLVAHELGQHWFGDYVQGRDWADIWLNEGFATYMTALYTQYHEGNDAYRYEIYGDQNTALDVEAARAPRPLVDSRVRRSPGHARRDHPRKGRLRPGHAALRSRRRCGDAIAGIAKGDASSRR